VQFRTDSKFCKCETLICRAVRSKGCPFYDHLSMIISPAKKILIVDDYVSIRETMTFLLGSAGHDIYTAEDGFGALLQLKCAIPDLILSDLNMPRMSGFELLSVVRRRFPQVLVVAMSGAYNAAEAVPGGVIADAFYAKGRDEPKVLLTLVAGLFETSASQVIAHTRQSAPVWIPRNGKDSHGIPYIVVTCTDCLRSFPLSVPGEVTSSVLTTRCIFCLSDVRYIIDFSLSVASPNEREETLASVAGRRAGSYIGKRSVDCCVVR
jgi:CheY-like chemotaxis protein